MSEAKYQQGSARRARRIGASVPLTVALLVFAVNACQPALEPGWYGRMQLTHRVAISSTGGETGYSEAITSFERRSGPIRVVSTYKERHYYSPPREIAHPTLPNVVCYLYEVRVDGSTDQVFAQASFSVTPGPPVWRMGAGVAGGGGYDAQRTYLATGCPNQTEGAGGWFAGPATWTVPLDQFGQPDLNSAKSICGEMSCGPGETYDAEWNVYEEDGP